MVHQIPVPQAKYELLNDVGQPRWKGRALSLGLLLLCAGALLLLLLLLTLARAWTHAHENGTYTNVSGIRYQEEREKTLEYKGERLGEVEYGEEKESEVEYKGEKESEVEYKEEKEGKEERESEVEHKEEKENDLRYREENEESEIQRKGETESEVQRKKQKLENVQYKEDSNESEVEYKENKESEVEHKEEKFNDPRYKEENKGSEVEYKENDSRYKESGVQRKEEKINDLRYEENGGSEVEYKKEKKESEVQGKEDQLNDPRYKESEVQRNEEKFTDLRYKEEKETEVEYKESELQRKEVKLKNLRYEEEKESEVESEEESRDAAIASWVRRARMYAESAKENQAAADGNDSGRTAQELRSPGTDRQILVCYYTLPSPLSPSPGLPATRARTAPCTHTILGFATVVNSTVVLPGAKAAWQEAARTLRLGGSTKLMLSVGGGGESGEGFKEMVRSHGNRKRFIRSFLTVSRQHGFEGLDLDWEFPGWLGADERERIRFSQLLQEFRREFDRSGRRLLLSVAVGAPQAIVDQSYVVPDMARHVDFVNLMSYDYHFYVWYYPVTGLNSALYPTSRDTGYLSTLNVNFSASYWLSKGMPRSKLVIGVPTYGHTYLLDNPANHGLVAPATGFGRLGESGFVDFETICGFLENGGRRVFMEDGKVPYAFGGREWVSYDDEESVGYKAQWIRAGGFAGAMILSLNADDWRGHCRNSTLPFPLTRTIARILDVSKDDGRSL